MRLDASKLKNYIHKNFILHKVNGDHRYTHKPKTETYNLKKKKETGRKVWNTTKHIQQTKTRDKQVEAHPPEKKIK